MTYNKGYVEFTEEEKQVINRVEWDTDAKRRCPLCIVELNEFGEAALLECGLPIVDCWGWK